MPCFVLIVILFYCGGGEVVGVGGRDAMGAGGRGAEATVLLWFAMQLFVGRDYSSKGYHSRTVVSVPRTP